MVKKRSQLKISKRKEMMIFYNIMNILPTMLNNLKPEKEQVHQVCLLYQFAELGLYRTHYLVKLEAVKKIYTLPTAKILSVKNVLLAGNF